MLFFEVEQLLQQSVEIYHDKLTQFYFKFLRATRRPELHDYDYIIFYFNVRKLDT